MTVEPKGLNKTNWKAKKAIEQLRDILLVVIPLRIDFDSVTMSKNALGIWYESRTILRIGEFAAKVLNSSKLMSRISNRPTNCKNSIRTIRIS